MNKTKIKLKPEDIDKFYTVGGKGKNDEDNCYRESIIENIFDIKNFENDSKYGKKWIEVKNEFIKALKEINNDYDSYIIKKNPKTRDNYDFDLCFEKNGVKINEYIEFKYNADNITKIPQLLQITDKSCIKDYEMCEVLYAEFYYDNYLDEFIKNCKNSESIKKISKTEYLKNIHNFNKRKENPFMKKLYENNVNKNNDVIKKSYEEYLKKYNIEFKFDKITEKLYKSQKNKIYLIWKNGKFNVKKINVEHINITKIIEIKKSSFVVNVENFKYNIEVRICWKNGNGICNPSWKFGYIEKNEKINNDLTIDNDETKKIKNETINSHKKNNNCEKKSKSTKTKQKLLNEKIITDDKIIKQTRKTTESLVDVKTTKNKHEISQQKQNDQKIIKVKKNKSTMNKTL